MQALAALAAAQQNDESGLAGFVIALGVIMLVAAGFNGHLSPHGRLMCFIGGIGVLLGGFIMLNHSS